MLDCSMMCCPYDPQKGHRSDAADWVKRTRSTLAYKGLMLTGYEMLMVSLGNGWAVAADVCNLGNRSLTCSGARPPSSLCRSRHESAVISDSMFLLPPRIALSFSFLSF
ncbi:hypothetical protein EYF80_031567 [Liparis tanakae]|uniref:Uncharacterized protein n=1 Tax=Liparis tanakae TaxID=230148 RepID=A0A4Z2GX32_9TELE|nr:hypothetical protein EYF80_031567 [Liparis tanakae]